MREWLTVIIACLIIGVLLDGLRRMRAAKRNEMRMSLSMHKGTNKEDLAAYGSELPNGGARVVSKRDVPPPKVSPKKPRSASENPVPKHQEELDLDQHVPLLMNVDDDLDGRTEPTIGAPVVPEKDIEPVVPASVDAEPVADPVDDDGIDEDAYDRVLFSGKTDAVHTDAGDREPTLAEAAPDEVYVISVVAPKGEVFAGPAVKDAILGAGLRFGSRKIFHYHQDEDGEGPIQFSLVNMVQPGIFDLQKFDELETPGLSMFMTLPMEGSAIAAFDAMVTTARTIAEALEGDLKDEQHSTLTQQTVEHNRARVTEYERKRQLELARA